MNTALQMNTDLQIPPPPMTDPPANATAPGPDPAPAATPAPLPPTDPSQPRRNGKIAHLPKEQRDLINHLFDDGATYETVRDKLAEQGILLNLQNLSDWYHGGYQDELQARERRVLLRESREHLLELAAKDDSPTLTFVGLQVAVTQLAQQLAELAPGSHKQSFQTNTDHYLRMLNTLARISKAILAVQAYQDEAAKIAAAQTKELDMDRELSDREYELLVKRMDRVFHMPVRNLPAPSPPPNKASP